MLTKTPSTNQIVILTIQTNEAHAIGFLFLFILRAVSIQNENYLIYHNFRCAFFQ